MITGKAHINGKLACILVDPGATFSFISSTYIMYDKLEISDLNEPIIVSMPKGMSVVCNNVYRDVPVKINEGEIRWNFIPLYISEFDAVLEMNGLSHYRANVNYYTRWVEFKKENREKITYFGKK